MWGQTAGRKQRTSQRRHRDDTATTTCDDNTSKTFITPICGLQCFCVGKEHVTSSSSGSLNAIELREQLVGVGFPVAIEVVLNVADRYFLAWKAAMLQSSELTDDELLLLIDQFVFTKNGEEMTPFDQLKLYNLIWKHLTQQRDIQVKLCTFDALYGFIDKVR